jgi:hypothetical protein
MSIFDAANAAILSHPAFAETVTYRAGAGGNPAAGTPHEISGVPQRDAGLEPGALMPLQHGGVALTLHVLVSTLTAAGIAAPLRGDVVVTDGGTYAVAYVPEAPEHGAWTLPLQRLD